MKIFVSDRTVFIWRTVLVCVIFALTLTACISGSLAVSDEDAITNYLPRVTESTVFKITLFTALAVSYALLFVTNRSKGKQSTLDGQDRGKEVQGKPSRTARIISCISRYLSLLPSICSLYVFYFALSDESLGSWGNAVMITAFISAIFFLFKISGSLPVGTVLCGFGVFAFGAIVIASLYLDHVIEINSDFKLLVQFGAVGVIISAISDTRRVLSRIASGWFISLKAIGFVLCSVCPAVIFSLPSIEGIEFPPCYSVYSLFYLACAVSFAFEIISELFADRSRCI